MPGWQLYALSRIYTSKFSLTSFSWQGRLARVDDKNIANFSLSRKTCSCRRQKHRQFFLVKENLSRKTCSLRCGSRHMVWYSYRVMHALSRLLWKPIYLLSCRSKVASNYLTYCYALTLQSAVDISYVIKHHEIYHLGRLSCCFWCCVCTGMFGVRIVINSFECCVGINSQLGAGYGCWIFN